LSGPFKAWDGRSLREWQQDRIAEIQEKCERLTPMYLGEFDDSDLPF
jgi:hypothetical protein